MILTPHKFPRTSRTAVLYSLQKLFTEQRMISTDTSCHKLSYLQFIWLSNH